MPAYTVSSASELAEALQKATGGDEILLEPGSYGSLQLSGYNPNGTVTIRSADGQGSARFNSVNIENSSNVTVKDVEVYYPSPIGDASALGIVSIEDSRNIEIASSEIHSSVSGTPMGGRGLVVSNSSSVKFIDNDVHHVGKGAVLSKSNNLSILENDFNYLRNDTMQVIGVRDSVIENNFGARKYYPQPGDHADFIQFTGSDSHNVTIKGNVSLLETVGNVQGIFLDDANYTQIHIENNVISTGMARGISISAGSGNSATNNTVVHLDGTTGSKASFVGGALSSSNNIYVNWKDSGTNEVISLEYKYSEYFEGIPDGGKLGLTIDDFAPVEGSAAETSGAYQRIEELLTGKTPDPKPVPENTPPEASSDAFTTEENTSIDLDVLANDVDADGDTIAILSVSDPAGGTIVVNKDGTLTYTPDANFVGKDSFSYVIRDPSGATDEASIDVTVTATEDDSPPIARDDAVGIDAGKELTFDVFSNDSDPDGSPLTLDSYTDPNHGTLVHLDGGRFTYVPDAGFFGQDSFSYTLVDDSGNWASATVGINIKQEQPTAGTSPVFSRAPHQFDGNSGRVLIIDHDPALELSSGAVEFSFTADRLTSRQGLISKDAYGFGDGGHFSVMLVDGDVVVRLQSKDDSYIIRSQNSIEVGETYHLAVNFGSEGMSLWIDGEKIGSNDYSGGLTGNDEAVVIGANQWRSEDSIVLQDYFDGSIGQVSVFDEVLSASQIAEFAQTENANTNMSPVARSNGYRMEMNESITFDVLKNDVDPDGDPVSVESFTDTLNGDLLSLGDGYFEYTPSGGFSGVDTFEYIVTDGRGHTDMARVRITVELSAQEGLPAPVFAENESVFSGNGKDAVIVDHNSDYAIAEGTLLIDFTADALSSRQGLFTKDAYSFGEGGHFSVLIEDDDLIVRLQDDVKDYQIEARDVVRVGESHQMALTFGPDGMSLWLDGSVVGTNAYTGGIEENAEPLVVGANQWASSAETADKITDGFDGVIDYLALYDLALHEDAFDEIFT